MTNPKILRREIASAALAMRASEGHEQAMQIAADAIRNLVPGCAIAAISVLTHDGIQSPICSIDPDLSRGSARDLTHAVRSSDELQYQIDEGACHDAMTDNVTVHSTNLAIDPRWPRWAPYVAKTLGMRSLVSHPLAVGSEVLGALNIYGEAERAFSSDDLGQIATFAVHVSVALAAARHIDDLTDALDSRTLIGQATGVLMMTYDLDPEAAFATLARVSQTTGIQLRVLATHVVSERQLPATTL